MWFEVSWKSTFRDGGRFVGRWMGKGGPFSLSRCSVDAIPKIFVSIAVQVSSLRSRLKSRSAQCGVAHWVAQICAQPSNLMPPSTALLDRVPRRPWRSVHSWKLSGHPITIPVNFQKCSKVSSQKPQSREKKRKRFSIQESFVSFDISSPKWLRKTTNLTRNSRTSLQSVWELLPIR